MVLNTPWLSLLNISKPLLFCSIADAKEINTESLPFQTHSKNNNLIGNNDDTEGVTEGVTLGVFVGVLVGVIEGVTEEENELDGVTDIDELGETEGVDEKLVDGVFVGVFVGVLVGVPLGVLDGVLEGVSEIEGVLETELDGELDGVLELDGEAEAVLEGVGETVANGAISSLICCLISNTSDLDLLTLVIPNTIKNAFINFLLSIIQFSANLLIMLNIIEHFPKRILIMIKRYIAWIPRH